MAQIEEIITNYRPVLQNRNGYLP